MTIRSPNPYVLLTLTALFWSGNMVVGRWIRDDIPPFSLAVGRWSIALLLILPFALPRLRAEAPRLALAWPTVLGLGLLGVGSYNTFAYIALQTTTATNASLLNAFIPIATVVLAWLLLGKRLHGREAAGIVLSLAGVGIIVAKGSLATLLGLSLTPGDLWMLAAVLTWGLYTVLLQRRPQGVSPMVLLLAMTLVGLGVLIPLAGWELLFGGRALVLTPPALLGVLYTGVFPGFLGYVFYNAGVAAVGPARGALFIHLMPVFGTILAALFLDERVASFHLAGIALVFAGIALTTGKRPH